MVSSTHTLSPPASARRQTRGFLRDFLFVTGFCGGVLTPSAAGAQQPPPRTDFLRYCLLSLRLRFARSAADIGRMPGRWGVGREVCRQVKLVPRRNSNSS
jgi:hypothetical protein